ncbi:hypothetical protein [Streptomyces atriruber]|uniref:hypothetical protein n=1 Tax=Streptomyces atriruber TaxID=545121 RepID=UPI0012FEEB4C|nr:hypothetical protein [Streptomyces atriruber]
MKRSSAGTLAVLLLLPVACTAEDEPPHGVSALKTACEGVLDSGSLAEAEKSTEIEKVRSPSDPKISYASAAKDLKESKVEVCNVPFEEDPTPGSPALRIQFDVSDGPLYPREERRSTNGYRAYGLKNGMQAVSAGSSSTILFPCTPKGSSSSINVTGTIDNDLDLTAPSQFRAVFGASDKMIAALKCENKIFLPNAATMKPFPKD